MYQSLHTTMSGGDDRFEVLTKRTETLRVLAERPQTKPDLMDRLGVSRSTIDRAIRELEAAGLVDTTDEGYTTSATGRLALNRYDRFRTETAAVFDAAPVLSDLPPAADIPVAMLTGAETVHATSAAPYRPIERFLRALGDTDRYRAVLPTVADARQIRVLHDRVVTGGATAELVAPASVIDHLETDFERRLSTMADTDRFTVRSLSVETPSSADTVGSEVDRNQPPYGVALLEAADRVTAWILVYREDGTLGGVVANDADEAVEWARRRFRAHQTAARPVTDRLHGSSEPAEPLPASLQREGFVHVSASLFANGSPDPPQVAWRAGLGLQEVYAGFAIDRTDPKTGDSLTTTLLDTLQAEDHCAVIGPPGIGKSTICKQVACEWYANGDGPVFYRRGGEDAEAFQSVDDLIEAVHSVTGRPLVVVEDATRAHAADIAEVIDRLSPAAAAVLLDARESEWRTTLEADHGRLWHEVIETVRVPTLSERDRERLVTQVETTLETAVPDGLSALETDWFGGQAADDQPEAAEATAQTIEQTPSLFLHRLITESTAGTGSTTDDTATALATAFDRLLETLARDDGLAAGLTVNLLNVAGIAVEPGHVRAIAGENADQILETLTGAVFLETDAGSRTVHHAWSLQFLRRAGEQRPGEAAAAIEAGVDALVDLSSDPAERAHLRAGAAGEWLGELADDPAGWRASMMQRLFRTLRSLPTLAALFEHDTHRVRLPPELPPTTELDCRIDRAKAHTDARNAGRAAAALDRAEERLETFGETVDRPTRGKYHAELAMARGTLARQREDLATAADEYQAALDHADDVESAHQRGRALNGLGAVAGMHGNITEAVERFEAALAASRAAEDIVTQSNVLRNLGNVAVLRGEHATAVGHYEESISLARRHGLFTALAGRYVSLGEAYLQQAAYENAATAYTEGLQVARRVGAPGPEANAVGGLAELALERGNLETADERFERAVALFERLDRPRWLAKAKHQWGVLARRRGDVATALDRLRTALATAEGVDDDRLHAEISTDLGFAELDAGNADSAADRFRRALRAWDATGLEVPSGRAKRGLAAVAFDRGELADAERFVNEALARLRNGDRQRDVAEAQLLAGRIAATQGDSDHARERLAAAEATFETIEATDRAALAADLRTELSPDDASAAGDQQLPTAVDTEKQE